MRVFGAPTPPQSVSKYYFLGKQRLAMRQNGKLTYLHGDHLGSASLATDAAGVTLSQQRYLPYGGLRWAQSGSVFPTDWQYTDQQRQTTHLTGIGVVEYYDYRARMYDPKIGRFISPDSIVPDEKNPQSLNRYMYTLGNPVKFTDPSGHSAQSCAQNMTQDCWEERWNNAHGFFRVGNRWEAGKYAEFWDENILNDVMGELGITFQNGNSTWSRREKEIVGQGVVALAHKLGEKGNEMAGFDRLKNQLGGGVTFTRDVSTWSGGPACVCGFGKNVSFGHNTFTGGENYIRYAAVHELGHVLDYMY